MVAFSPIPILNIMKESVNCLESGDTSLFIMATRSTVESGLYDKEIGDKNKNLIWNASLQDMVDELIIQSKATGISQETLILWSQLEISFVEQGVQEVIIACTDLSFCVNYRKDYKIRYYDSSLILAESLVSYFIEQKIKRK